MPPNRLSKGHVRLVLGLVVSLVFCACSDDRLVAGPCLDDEDCGEGLLCEFSTCVDAASKSCEVVTEGNPILQPSPHVLSFGALETQSAERTVELHNLGNCTLTVFEASLPAETPAPFSCEVCTGRFPLEIFPGRKKDIVLSFKPDAVGAYDSEVVILSDDKEFPELRVPIHADFRGVPNLRVAPNPVDFGYVAQGRVLKKQVQVTNQGTGVAVIELLSMALDPPETQDFAMEAVTLPMSLPPVSSGDEAKLLTFQAQYHPRSVGKHAAQLVLVTNKGELRVPLAGNSETPPKLSFSPAEVDLGQVPLGQSNHSKLTLLNEGGVPLQVKYAWGGTSLSTDLFATPLVLPDIAPGAYLEMDVAVTATALGAINGLLILSSNDPAWPSVTVPVFAQGVPGVGPEVVKIEMNYENGSDSAFDSDLRNMDLTLEHPFGYVCNKSTPEPKNWGQYGNPTWLAFAPKEEPERIILADAIKDGTYRVMLQYMEDCRSLPTDLMAGLLGISVEALTKVLSEGVISVDGKDVSEMVAKTCLQRGTTSVTVRVYVNGTLKGEKTVALSKKGDSLYALDLVRLGGKFSVK